MFVLADLLRRDPEAAAEFAHREPSGAPVGAEHDAQSAIDEILVVVCILIPDMELSRFSKWPDILTVRVESVRRF